MATKFSSSGASSFGAASSPYSHEGYQKAIQTDLSRMGDRELTGVAGAIQAYGKQGGWENPDTALKGVQGWGAAALKESGMETSVSMARTLQSAIETGADSKGLIEDVFSGAREELKRRARPTFTSTSAGQYTSDPYTSTSAPMSAHKLPQAQAQSGASRYNQAPRSQYSKVLTAEELVATVQGMLMSLVARGPARRTGRSTYSPMSAAPSPSSPLVGQRIILFTTNGLPTLPGFRGARTNTATHTRPNCPSALATGLGSSPYRSAFGGLGGGSMMNPVSVA